MKKILSIPAVWIFCFLGITSTAYATVSPDRTRIILNASDKSVSIRLTNQSKISPYLAQSWIEDIAGKKTRDFISPLPPLIRIDPLEQVQVRLIGLPALQKQPQDRETLFFYNMREIPPRSEGKNVMQMAMQSRIKLFWRPKAIELKEGQTLPLEKVTISRTATSLILNNPTPYHVTVGYLGLNGKTLMPGARSIMVPPFSQANENMKHPPENFQIGYVGDYGGLDMFKVSCNSIQKNCQIALAK